MYNKNIYFTEISKEWLPEINSNPKVWQNAVLQAITALHIRGDYAWMYGSSVFKYDQIVELVSEQLDLLGVSYVRRSLEDDIHYQKKDGKLIGLEAAIKEYLDYLVKGLYIYPISMQDAPAYRIYQNFMDVLYSEA